VVAAVIATKSPFVLENVSQPTPLRGGVESYDITALEAGVVPQIRVVTASEPWQCSLDCVSLSPLI
jgi:hypothetical protein